MDCEREVVVKSQEHCTEKINNGTLSSEANFSETDKKGKEDETFLMSLEEIEASMKQMVDDLKHKRENDLAILEEVKKEIMAQAKRSCKVLEQHMAKMHAAKSKEMDDKWEDLVKVLNKIKESEAEIEKTKFSLSLLCKDSLDTEP